MIKKKRVFWLVAISIALGFGLLTFASARKSSRPFANQVNSTTPQNPSASANAKSEDYVRTGRLWPQLRRNLKALGDRVEKPGKERVTMIGTLTSASDSQPVPVILILEFPDHLRLQMQGIGPHRIITFNGQTAGKAGGRLDRTEEDIIETLVYDTAEHFLIGQNQGTATRFLGERFRLDDAAQANYTGPYFDLYQTTERIKHVTPDREQTKLYCFNSDTHLLERINYELDRNGLRTAVEVRISGWQKVQDQQVPLRIVRLENNQPVFALTINLATVGTKVDDGAFGT